MSKNRLNMHSLHSMRKNGLTTNRKTKYFKLFIQMIKKSFTDNFYLIQN